jgi:alpha-ketoglutarate-dependent taurine dioxygenase
VNTDLGAAVRCDFLKTGQYLPLLVTPAEHLPEPPAWAAANRPAIDANLRRYGAILFRGFDIATPARFEAFAEAMSPGLYGQYGDLPKQEEGQNIYRSTPYPQERMILFHNESSHLDCWTSKQWFYCEVASRTGGATPIVDVRRMLLSLPADVVATFERKALMYIRTFDADLDVSWQDFFKTDERAEVEARCRATGAQLRWFDDDVLQIRTFCPAVIRHPLTGERTFFNQLQLHHPYNLGGEIREGLLELVGEDFLPRNVRYGDGSCIEDEVMELIGRTYEACAVRFDWQQGDVIMLDNMLVAHARDPYEGPRKIAVAMSEMFFRSDLPILA